MGLDHVLPPTLGEEAHICQSAALPSPFWHHSWPEADVRFVAHTITVWGSGSQSWRSTSAIV